MSTLHTLPSAALTAAFLRDLRTMLNSAFPDDFSDEDWNHALGGIHVWIAGSQGVVSHGSVVERTVVCSGHTLRVGFVEAVATVAAHRRQGHGTSVMRRVSELVCEHHPLGVLSTGTHAFYEALGWERWRGPTFVDGLGGRCRTPRDDGSIMVLRTPRSPNLDLDGEIVCDWRSGDVW